MYSCNLIGWINDGALKGDLESIMSIAKSDVAARNAIEKET